MMTRTASSIERVRRTMSNLAVRSLFAGMTGVGALDGGASKSWARHPNLRHYRDIPYNSQFSDLKLDVHRPDTSGTFPALIHVHGGAFRMMSRKTHRHIADAYARGGFVVFNIEYRLGPENPYPAPLQDVLEALAWVGRNGAGWGAETDTVFLAGESAGANLCVAASLLAASGMSSNFGVDLSHVTIGGLISACGILEVTDAERFQDGTAYGAVVTSQLRDARDGYLRGVEYARWADPLRVLRRWRDDERDLSLPPLLSFAGSRDPLAVDARELHQLWTELGGESEHDEFEGGGHSFHAFMWRNAAADAWARQHQFLSRVAHSDESASSADRLAG
jgi:acetyl esterase